MGTVGASCRRPPSSKFIDIAHQRTQPRARHHTRPRTKDSAGRRVQCTRDPTNGRARAPQHHHHQQQQQGRERKLEVDSQTMAPNLPSNYTAMPADSVELPVAKRNKQGESWYTMAEGKAAQFQAENKLTILVDMDNTLCDYEEAFARTLKAEYPEIAVVPSDKRLNWDILEDYPADVHAKCKSVNGVKGFFLNMKPIEGGVEAVKAMLGAGHNVLIVSAPDSAYAAQCSEEKQQWIQNHLGDEWKDRLILTRDKTTVRGTSSSTTRPRSPALSRPSGSRLSLTRATTRASPTSPGCPSGATGRTSMRK